MKLRSLVIGIIASTVCFAATIDSAFSEEADESVTVRIGISARSPSFLLPFLAEREGLFRKNGVENVEISFGPGPQTSSALAGGAFDMTVTAAPAVDLVGMTSGRAKVVALAQTHSGQALLGGPGVNTVKDLKGKKVAINGGKGSATSMLVLAALRREGMSLDDVTLIVLQDSAASAKAFLSGQVDGVAAFEPNTRRLLDGRQGTKIIDELNDVILPGAQFGVNDSWAKEHPDLVVGVLRSVDQALAIFKNEPVKAKTLIAEQLNLADNKAMVDLLYDYSNKFLLDHLIAADERVEGGVLELLKLSGFSQATNDKLRDMIAPEYAEKALAK